MRPDMEDVLMDEPRRGGGLGYPRRRRERGDPERVPSREGMRRPYRAAEQKSFGDHTQPLHRFLEKNVGRPWDKVWSEICAHADARGIRGYHLRQHVRMYVEECYFPGETGPRSVRGYALRPGWLYVDGRGFLRRVKRTRSRKG